eukprot:754657-Hanusia_phi.AAC.6
MPVTAYRFPPRHTKCFNKEGRWHWLENVTRFGRARSAGPSLMAYDPVPLHLLHSMLLQEKERVAACSKLPLPPQAAHSIMECLAVGRCDGKQSLRVDGSWSRGWS